MTIFSPYPFHPDLPFYPTLFLDSTRELAHTSDLKTPIFKREETSGPTTVAPPLKDKLKDQKPVDQARLTAAINQDLNSLSDLTQNFEKLKQTADRSETAKSMTSIVQETICDIVLEGGIEGIKSGLPFIVNLSEESNHELIHVTEYFKNATDAIVFGTGIVSLIYKAAILKTAQEELDKLDRRDPPLAPDQRARLEKVKKMIKYEESLLNSQIFEQGIRNAKILLSGLSLALDNPAAQELIAKVVGYGGQAALFGYFFYEAHHHLKAHREWSEEFNAWMEEQTPTINKIASQDPKILEAMHEQSEQILAKIDTRRKQKLAHIKTLNEKISSGEIDISTIHKRVIEIKRPALHQHLKKLKAEDLSAVSFQASIMDKFGTPIKSEIAVALKEACLQRERIEKSTLSPERKKERLAAVEAEIHQLETEALQNWIDRQSPDDVLSTYVDYHSVLDPTLKNSIAQMVTKKHKVEESFLKMKKIFTGTRFTAATIIAGIALALTIIALVSNPIGAAALVITLLTVASALLTAGLYAASYHQAYGQKPGLTAATLKGSYVLLYYYYAREALSSLKEKIVEFVRGSKQEKRDEVSEVINSLPSVAQLSSQKRTGEATDSDIPQKTQKKEGSDFQKSKVKSQEWAEKAEALKRELDEIAWKDFAKQADLKVAEDQEAFDTLETLNYLLTNCDLEMLSPETKQLLEHQLGIPVNALESEIKKNPSAVREMVRDFFNMSDDAFVKFVGQQRI